MLVEDERIIDDIETKYQEKNVSSRELVVWGMGYADTLYSSAYRHDDTPIRYYVSSNYSGEHNGVKVIRPEEIKEFCNNPLILICAQNPKVIKSIVSDIKALGDSIDYLIICEYFFGKYSKNLKYNLEHMDDESQSIYLKLLEKMVSCDFYTYDIYNRNQYFDLPQFMHPDEGEVVIDCGAYVGDTLEKYIFAKKGAFKEYYCLEPDSKNFISLENRIERLNKEWNYPSGKITAMNVAVGESTDLCYFEEKDSAESAVGNKFTGTKKTIVALDDVFSNKQVSMIKADIEGYELDMLSGAKKLLLSNQPLLYVSIYHNAYDFIFVPFFILSLNLNYRIHIRHHDVVLGDSVCYAYVEG